TLLLHEQGNVLEGIAVVHSEAGAQDMIALAGQIIRQPDARAEVLAVIARLLADQGCRQGTERGGRLEFLEGAAVGNVRAAKKVKVFVPANSEVHGHPAHYLPVILEVQSKLLRVLDDEGWITHRDAHSIHRTGGFKSVWKCAGAATCCRGIGCNSEDATGVGGEVNLQGRIELEEAAHKRCPDVIKSGLEGMAANGLGQIVLELPLALDGVLRNVGIGPELRRWERDKRS